jgi:hypothetical protein
VAVAKHQATTVFTKWMTGVRGSKVEVRVLDG